MFAFFTSQTIWFIGLKPRQNLVVVAELLKYPRVEAKQKIKVP